MTGVMVVQGRELSAEDIGLIQGLMTEHRDWEEPGSAKSFATGGTGATHAAASRIWPPARCF